jgi:hypothetical protein
MTKTSGVNFSAGVHMFTKIIYVVHRYRIFVSIQIATEKDVTSVRIIIKAQEPTQCLES